MLTHFNSVLFISCDKVFSYIIKGAICALCLCEKSFPRKSAFAYLEEVANEFNGQYGNKVDSVTRPYHFIEFGKCGFLF